MVKKIINLLKPVFLVALWLLVLAKPALAQEPVNLYFFYGETCPHCAKEEVFLEELVVELDYLKIHSFEVTADRENAQLLKEVGEALGENIRGVPFTVVGSETFSGYLNDETTGAKIREAVLDCCEECEDLVAPLLTSSANPITSEVNEDDNDCTTHPDSGEAINLPLFGHLHPSDFSLPVLTVLIAAIDGFNPCAMWVLIFLISLLLGLKDKKRRWILGISFIAASAFVYFLFLAAWLTLFQFIGMVKLIRIVIGLVALGSGAYHLREYFVNKDAACKAIGGERKKKVMTKLEKVTQNKYLILAILGMVVLAFGVNLVELVCSAGLPAIYTQVLAQSQLSQWQYYSYLTLYVLIFMFDDLFIFWSAMKAAELAGMSGKYSRYSNLIGGILIFVLGMLLIFKPELIMFG